MLFASLQSDLEKAKELVEEYEEI